ncbi:MAG TPA: hypothetical protein VEB22_06485 [Phycisphaerales bacterium]|nr:hypothetical protein [Phycisphaerales bacterium]
MVQLSGHRSTRTTFLCVLAAVGVAAAAGAARAAVIWADPADRTIAHLSTPILLNGGSAEVGNNGGIMRTYVVPFQLPARPAGTVVTTADTQFWVLRNGAPNMNIDLYGLTPRMSSAVLGTDAYAGVLDPGATLIQDNFSTNALTSSSAYTILHTDAGGDATLVAYLNNAYANVGAGGWVFLRLSCDNAAVPNLNSYFVNAAETTWQGPRIELTFAAVPTPGATALAGLGALAAARRKRR